MLVFIGFGGVLLWLASIVIPAAWERWSERDFDRQIQQDQDRQIQPEEPAGPAPLRIRSNQVLGRLTIPRLHLIAMVREGDEEDTLSFALGHIPGTALPWQNGNVGVAGHRDKVFRGLRKIRPNDLIRFETLQGEYVYRVEGTQIVEPSQVSVLRGGRVSELTLVTCYPFYYIGSAPDRFIVKARQVRAPANPE